MSKGKSAIPTSTWDVARSPAFAKRLATMRDDYRREQRDEGEKLAQNYHASKYYAGVDLDEVSIRVCTPEEQERLLQSCAEAPWLDDGLAGEWFVDQLKSICVGPHEHRIRWDADQVGSGVVLRRQLTDDVALLIEIVQSSHFTRVYSPVEKRAIDVQRTAREVRIAAHGVSQCIFQPIARRYERVMTTLSRVLRYRREHRSWLMNDADRDMTPIHGEAWKGSGERTPDPEFLRAAEPAVRLEEDETFRRCVKLFAEPPSKKDQMKRRLRNAIGLMTEAEHAEHTAVSLALWCSALEAMVVKKGSESGITETLAANVATLLQPNAERRLETMARIKKLYSGRSDLVHGSTVDEQPQLSEQARRLAAGVFLAVMEWMRSHDTIENEAMADEQFFECIKKTDKTGKPMEGVSPDLAQFLP